MSDERLDTPRTSFAAALCELAEEERCGLADHAPVQDLLAYREDLLAPAERERLADHLTLCRECREALLDLGHLERHELPPESSPPSSQEVAAAWQTLQRNLGEGSGATVVPFQAKAAGPRAGGVSSRNLSIAFRQAPAGSSGARRPWRRLAAGVLLAAASFWGGARWQQAQTAAPMASLPLLTLLPQEEITRGSEETLSTVPAGARYVLVLHVPVPLPEGDLAIDREGWIVYRAAIESSEDSTLTVVADGPLREPGRYRARLFTAAKGERREVASYRFVVGGEVIPGQI